MTRITVLDDTQGVVRSLGATALLDGLDARLEVLTERLVDAAALVAALRDTDCLILIRERTRLTADVIAALPKLKLVVQTGRLAGCIDLDACRARGIEVRDGSGNPIAPAELTWALILAAARRLVPYAQALGQGRWQRSAPTLEEERLGRSLAGRTLGVWGYGKIGRRVAAVGHALGMRIVAHGRASSQQAALADGHTFATDRRQFLAEADVLTLHLRLCAETRHLIGPDDLAAMRTDALLVNTSRAELIAPGALLQALDRGRPGAAALDVFEDEPVGAVPYLGHPRVLCTPHIGFVEETTYEAYFREAFGHVRDFLTR